MRDIIQERQLEERYRELQVQEAVLRWQVRVAAAGKFQDPEAVVDDVRLVPHADDDVPYAKKKLTDPSQLPDAADVVRMFSGAR